MGKDWKRCEMTKIRHSKLFWTTLVRKDWEKCKMSLIEHSKSFWTTLIGKDFKKCEMSNHFGWKRLEKVQNEQI